MNFNYFFIKPFLYRMIHGKFKNIKSVSDKKWDLCTEERVIIKPAIYIKDDIDKIKNISPWRNWESEKFVINGGEKICNPTVSFIINNVRIIDANIYSGTGIETSGYGKATFFSSNKVKPEKIDTANMVTTWSGSRWFGSLLLDDFPLELIADDPKKNIRLITKPFYHEQGYRELLGINDSRLVRNAYVNQLTVYADQTHNKFRQSRYKNLRFRLANRIPLNFKESNRMVYIRRGRIGDRRILENEDQIESFLHKNGFSIIDTESLSAEEIIFKTYNAKIVVGVEGSHLSHFQYSISNEGVVLVIQPPDRFSMVYKEFADCLGIKFAFIVGDVSNNGFTLSLNNLIKILDMLV